MLTARKMKAVELLYLGKTDEEVAEIIGVTPICIRKWKQDKEFSQALIDISARKLSGLVPKAIENIKDILYSRTVKPETKLKASELVLNLGRVTEKSSETDSINIKVEYV